MTTLNFAEDHLGVMIILTWLLIVALVLWAFWNDKPAAVPPVSRFKPAVKPLQSAPIYHKGKYQSPFHAAAKADEIKPSHHIKPKKH